MGHGRSAEAQSCGLLGEVVALGGAARPGRRAGVVLGGDVAVPARSCKWACTASVMVAAQARLKAVGRAQPGQWAVDLADRDCAAERGRRVVGEREEFVVPRQDLRQSVSSAVWASSCSAAIAAWIWYSQRRSRARAACRMRTPLTISAWFHRVRSCLSGCKATSTQHPCCRSAPRPDRSCRRAHRRWLCRSSRCSGSDLSEIHPRYASSGAVSLGVAEEEGRR